MTKSKMIRNTGLVAACAAIVLGGLIAIGQTEKKAEAEAAGAAPALSNDVLVSVNGATLTQAAVDAQIQQQLARFGGQLPAEQMGAVKNQLTQQIVNSFVVQNLLQQKAEEKNITVNDADVQKVLESISQQVPEGMNIEQALAAQGMTLDGLKEKIREDQKIQKLLEQELPDAYNVTDEEIAAFYQENLEQMKQPETVHARHILLQVDEDATDEEKAQKREKAEKIREQLEEGADFAATAEKESEGPTAERGGDLGTFPRGQMVPEFDEAAFTQEIGAIGPVIQTQFGFHIIKVLEHTEGKTRSLEETKEDIQAHLEQQKRQGALREYVEKLRGEADIVVPNQAQQQPQPDNGTE